MHKLAYTLTLVAVLVAVAGCGIADPYAGHARPSTTTSTSSSTSANLAQNPGELPAPPAPSASSQAPTNVQNTPERAIAQFATLYMNWTWRTLAAHQRELAQLSVEPARLAEREAAAASSADNTIAHSHVYNNGRILSIAPSLTNPNQWVIVTREQTGGNSQYDGLQASYHVTLAELAKVPGGWAIAKWLPQV